jgi:hypothetical protein
VWQLRRCCWWWGDITTTVTARRKCCAAVHVGSLAGMRAPFTAFRVIGRVGASFEIPGTPGKRQRDASADDDGSHAKPSLADLTVKWTVPASRMKANNEHRMPLSDCAMTILREMEKLRASDFVFGGFSG